MRSAPMESSFIPNSNPAIGQTSTPWSARSKKPNKCGRRLCAPICCEFSLVRRSTFDVRRSAFSLQSAIQRADGEASCCEPSRSVAPWTLRLFNAQRSTLNAQRSIQTVRRWALDVGRWAFSSFRRVRGAWWPSRSSKPLLIPHTRDQDRFDSYPLRHSKFDGRWVMFEVATTSNLQSNINLQTSNLKHPRKEVNACRASKSAGSHHFRLALVEQQS